ncbi:hypothetical protein N7532_001553 [Penicillium argentinense]|uniref:Uncharacterized protein n=1 Tax=Penicillium argentinense TaxID=1131581 RepID=A0A9W9G2Y5_9EURO|nr:uncharacterized protein N7532_001553 [Penicillium argentinense]KAJ5111018.1 hypothetical protein N7532_001553 [Penicillium argentinense]
MVTDKNCSPNVSQDYLHDSAKKSIYKSVHSGDDWPRTFGTDKGPSAEWTDGVQRLPLWEDIAELGVTVDPDTASTYVQVFGIADQNRSSADPD